MNNAVMSKTDIPRTLERFTFWAENVNPLNAIDWGADMVVVNDPKIVTGIIFGHIHVHPLIRWHISTTELPGLSVIGVCDVCFMYMFTDNREGLAYFDKPFSHIIPQHSASKINSYGDMKGLLLKAHRALNAVYN